MIYIIILLVLILIFLLARLFYIRNELRSIIKQLLDINMNKSDKKVTVGLLNKEIEDLTGLINNTIDMKKECEASKVKLQNDLRQAIANMSHDIRTPLTSIKGYIQFIKMDNMSDDERKEYILIAERRIKTLEVLLNDFYELSLIDSPGYELTIEKVNINRILQETLAEKYIDFVNRKLQPEIEVPGNNIYIAADEEALGRIIENLLSNTIKYAKDNISVYLKVEEPVVLLQISNNTTDLTNEDVKKIFDRFYMADKTRRGSGTGLGLAITKELVEKMNGNITAELKGDMLIICCMFKCINV